MTEELQHLIDKIQDEAIKAAETKAEEIVSHAKQKAAQIVKDSERQARENLEKAERDAKAHTERSTRTLEQAARDLLITVGQGVENIMSDMVAESVKEAMTIEVMERMLIKIAEACAAHAENSQIEFLVGPGDKQELVRFFAEKYREKLVKGIELHVDNEIFRGFRVSLVGDSVYHDFTPEAIAESLAHFLRPELSAIVHRVAREGEAGRNQEKDK